MELAINKKFVVNRYTGYVWTQYSGEALLVVMLYLRRRHNNDLLCGGGLIIDHLTDFVIRTYTRTIGCVSAPGTTTMYHNYVVGNLFI